MRSTHLIIACLAWAAIGSSAGEPAKTPEPHASFGFAFHYEYEHASMRLSVCAIGPHSPAQKAGLKAEDQIVAVDGRSDFRNSLEVLTYLFGKRPGERVKLTTLRGQRKKAITLVAAEATPQQVEAMRQTLELASEEATQHRVPPPPNSP